MHRKRVGKNCRQVAVFAAVGDRFPHRLQQSLFNEISKIKLAMRGGTPLA